MANNFASNPIYVDTVMTSGPGIGGALKVSGVLWNNPTTAGSTFVIQDTNGNTLLQGYASAANQSQYFPLNGFMFPAGEPGGVDWKVTTLSSGNLLIYYSF